MTDMIFIFAQLIFIKFDCLYVFCFANHSSLKQGALRTELSIIFTGSEARLESQLFNYDSGIFNLYLSIFFSSMLLYFFMKPPTLSNLSGLY